MAKKASIQAQRLGFNPDSAMSSLEFITSDNNTAKWGKPVQERSILNALAIYLFFLEREKSNDSIPICSKNSSGCTMWEH